MEIKNQTDVASSNLNVDLVKSSRPRDSTTYEDILQITIVNSQTLLTMLNDKSALKTISQINSNEIDSLKQNKRNRTITLTNKKTKRDNLENEDINFKEIYKNFNKATSSKEDKKAMDEVKSLTEEFYKNTYNKYHGLEIELAVKRKEVCLKIFKILRLLFKRAKDEQLQKIVVFFEYQIRKQVPNLGKKYF